MKKFLLLLIVLIALAGVVFYFGWIQYLIPDDGHGVVFSRSHGWEQEVVRPGTFEWRWQRLIPNNMTVHIFHTRPARVQIDASGTLPSGEIYRTVLADEPDLSYELRASVRIRVRPGELPLLASEDGVRPDTLDEWIEEKVDALRTRATEYLVDMLSAGDNVEQLSMESIEEGVVEHLESSFPRLEFSDFSLTSYRVPDFALYQEAQSLYLTALEAETDALIASSAERADRQARDDEIQRSLRSYGEVLDEFPILLEYFSLGIDPFQFQRLFDEE